MDRHWKVVKRIGSRISVECGEDRKLLACPTKPFAKQLFMMVRPGEVLDDPTVEMFEKARLPIRH